MQRTCSFSVNDGVLIVGDSWQAIFLNTVSMRTDADFYKVNGLSNYRPVPVRQWERIFVPAPRERSHPDSESAGRLSPSLPAESCWTSSDCVASSSNFDFRRSPRMPVPRYYFRCLLPLYRIQPDKGNCVTWYLPY